MITIGLTGWSQHPLIAPNSKKKLEEYSSYFPFVEIDTSFYGIPTQETVLSWIQKTPEVFEFIPKAYAAMTLHKKWDKDILSIQHGFSKFLEQFEPMIEAKKIKAFLFQFPPYFKYNQKNISYLYKIRKLMKDLSVAIEFRHPSWMDPANQNTTLSILKENSFIYTIVDEPQTPGNSTQQVFEVTHPSLSLYRLHGKNYSGWLNSTNPANWRKNRTNYNYTNHELKTIKKQTIFLNKKVQEVAVIFNNNAGGHAAKNAMDFQELLNIRFDNLNPQQLNLF